MSCNVLVFYFWFWRSKSDVWKLCILHIHGVCFLSRHLIILKDLEHIFHIGFAMHNVFDYGDWANRSSHFSTQFLHLSIDIHGLNLIQFSFICQFKNAYFIHFFFFLIFHSPFLIESTHNEMKFLENLLHIEPLIQQQVPKSREKVTVNLNQLKFYTVRVVNFLWL